MDESIRWWYSLDWKQRVAYRELLKVDIMLPELIDKLYKKQSEAKVN